MKLNIPNLDTKSGQVWLFSLMFKLCAVWPLDKLNNWNSLAKALFFLTPYIGVTWMIVATIGCLVALHDFPYDLFLICEQLFVTLEIMASLSLYFNIIQQKNLIYKILSKMNELPEPPKKRSYKTLRIFGKVYFIIYIFNTLYFALLPVLRRERKLPVSFLYYHYDSSPAYEIAYMTVFCEGIWMIPCNVTFDLSFIFIVKFLDAQLEALADRVNSINSKSDINYCIRLHQDILSIIKNFNNYLSHAFVGLFFFGGLEVCMILFEIIMMESFATVVVLFMIYSVSMFQFFMYSWYGSHLMKMMENISTAAYSANWYNFNKSERMSLLFLINRAQIASPLRASFLCKVDMKTFTSILQESLSYAMVLRQFQTVKN